MSVAGSQFLLFLFRVGPLVLYLALAALPSRPAWIVIAVVGLVLAYPWFLAFQGRPPFRELDATNFHWFRFLGLWTPLVLGAALAQAFRSFFRSRRAYGAFVLALLIIGYVGSCPLRLLLVHLLSLLA